MKIQQKEIRFAAISGLLAIAALFSMQHLVAAPKLLFGRSLSAIEPSLFPYITLSLIVVLAVSVIILSVFSLRRTKHSQAHIELANQEPEEHTGWMKTGLFFLLLTIYGALLKPVGFLISSFIVIFSVSLLLGNRNWIQIVLFALFAPIFLYLTATRLMLVSLPEINQIELMYTQALNALAGFKP